jgi:hypothetical protein
MTRDEPDQKPSPRSFMGLVCWRIIAIALLTVFVYVSHTAYMAHKADDSTNSGSGGWDIPFPEKYSDSILLTSLVIIGILAVCVCFIGILAENTDCDSDSIAVGYFSFCLCCLCLSECPAPACDGCDDACGNCAICSLECSNCDGCCDCDCDCDCDGCCDCDCDCDGCSGCL